MILPMLIIFIKEYDLDNASMEADFSHNHTLIFPPVVRKSPAGSYPGLGSFGSAVAGEILWGYFSGSARKYPHIQSLPREIPKNPG
jgi:hypothetical protein